MAEPPVVYPVILVGAGPGAPGLLTVRGREALQSAQVVIADRLVPQALLDADLPLQVELHVRGERRSELSQEEINRLLVEKAREGKRVVRLKGGDPFVFGRGGEEAEALAAAGLPFEVVPGVTAAIAAPAYAGIPITHRGLAGAVAFVTGHEAEDKGGGSVNWEALATGATTIVLYMSVTHLPNVVARLIAAGRAASTPVAVIERGTTHEQRVITATLADVVEKAREAKVAPPALTVVGEVVRMREAIAWFDRRPLHGKRMLAVMAHSDRDDEQPAVDGMDEAEEALARLGLDVEWGYPLYVVEHVERVLEAIPRLGRYRWIAFTSQWSALAFHHALLEAQLDVRALRGSGIASLAGRTAMALRSRVQAQPDLIVEGGGRELAEALIAWMPEDPGPVLFLRAVDGREELVSMLQAAGAVVDVVPAYETAIDAEAVAQLVASSRRAPFDAVAFGSPRGAFALLDAGMNVDGAMVGAIGRTTASALADRGVRVDLIASRPTYATLVEELGAALARKNESE